MNDEAVCRTVTAIPGLLIFRICILLDDGSEHRVYFRASLRLKQIFEVVTTPPHFGNGHTVKSNFYLYIIGKGVLQKFPIYEDIPNPKYFVQKLCIVKLRIANWWILHSGGVSSGRACYQQSYPI